MMSIRMYCLRRSFINQVFVKAFFFLPVLRIQEITHYVTIFASGRYRYWEEEPLQNLDYHLRENANDLVRASDGKQIIIYSQT